MITHSSEVKTVLIKYLEDRLENLDSDLRQMSLNAIDEYERGRCTEHEAFVFASFMQGMEYGLRVAEEVLDHLHCVNNGEPCYTPTRSEFAEGVSEYLEALGGE